MMKAKILIADDREVNRALLRACLEPLGYDVSVCASASEALQQARAHPPHVIVSDVHMHPTSGVLLCKYVKEDPELCRIPFLLFSASYPTEAEIREARLAGADCCMSRPIDPEVLIARVQACLPEATDVTNGP